MGPLRNIILGAFVVLTPQSEVVTVGFVNCSAARSDQVELLVVAAGSEITVIPGKSTTPKAVKLAANVEYTITTVDKRRDVESRMESKSVFDAERSYFVVDERGMYGQLDGLVATSPACP
jgi:hypothetical protein